MRTTRTSHRAAAALLSVCVLGAFDSVLAPALGAVAAAPAATAQVVPSGSLAGLRFHLVGRTDTVVGIARRYGVEPSLVRAANGIVADRIYGGSRLLLEHPNPKFVRRTAAPAARPTTTVPARPATARTAATRPAAAAGSPTGSYRVVAGDTLSGIAKRARTTLAALLAANRISATSPIFPGTVLRLPAAGATTTSTTTPAPSTAAPARTATTRPTAPATTGRTYKVVAGDTLSGIAKKARTTLSALMTANGLTLTSVILPGRVLRLPAATAAATPSGAAPSRAATPRTTTGRATAAPAPTTTAPAGSGATYASVLPALGCPVAGARFMNDWGFPRSGGRYHEGTDLFAPKGTPVTAPAAGTVRFSVNRLGGLSFSLTTDSGWVVYGTHLDTRSSVTGRVAAGTVLGTVGNSGNAAGGPPHLHMGLSPKGGRSANPYPVLRVACA